MLTTDYLTTKEAAAIIGVTVGRISQLRRSGELRSIQVDNRTWLIPRGEAERMAKDERPKVGRPRSSEK